MREVIYLVPVYTESIVGRSEQTINTADGRTFRRNNPKPPKIQIPIGFIKDSQSNRLITGLGERIDNPWHKDMNPNKYDFSSQWQSKFEDIIEMPMITRQQYLEIKFDLPYDYLTSNSKTKTMAQINYGSKEEMKNISPSFLDDFSYYIDFDGPRRLDTEKGLRESLAILAARNHPKIAPDQSSVNRNTHIFFITNEADGFELVKSNRDKIQSAIAVLDEVERNYSDFAKYQIATILEIIYGTATPTQVKTELSNYVWEQKKFNGESQESRSAKFKSLVKLMVSDPNKFEIAYFVKQAFNTQILRNAQGKIYWVSKRGIDNLYDLGTNLDSIKARFLNEKLVYDDTVDIENMYGLLYDELKSKGIRLE